MPVVNHIIQVLDTCEDEAIRGSVGHAFHEIDGHYVVCPFDRRGATDSTRVLCRHCRILITGDDLAALADTIAREVPHAAPT